MKRRKFSGKEEDQLQRLKRENDRLKKEVSSLRKQFKRIDLDKFTNLKELADSHSRMEKLEAAQVEEKSNWSCKECGRGVLRLVMVDRRDGAWYFRKCSDCPNRTRLKKYSDKVKK